jgi:uncharacterized protein YndB with AHSA1/START domain
MRKFEIVVDIAAPPSLVWPIVRDVERWHEWTASITRITRLDQGPLQVGSRAQVEQPKLPKNTFVVTAVEEGRGFTWETRSPGLQGAGHHWIEPIDGGRGSRVTLGVDFRGPLAWLVGRLYGRLTQRYIEMEAEGLKRRSETPNVQGRTSK